MSYIEDRFEKNKNNLLLTARPRQVFVRSLKRMSSAHKLVAFVAFVFAFVLYSIRDAVFSPSLGSLVICCLEHVANCLVGILSLRSSLASGFLVIGMMLLLACVHDYYMDCALFVSFPFSVHAFFSSCFLCCWSCYGNNS